MKIDIEERLLHFKQPAGTSRGVYTTRRIWIVTISDGTHCGVGECAPLPDLSCDAMNPHAYQRMLRQQCDEVERTGVVDTEALRDYPSMLFGIETAMLDYQAQHSEHKTLFDTAFARGEAGIPINGLVWMGTYDEMLSRMEEKLEQGFRCVKLKVGAIDFDRELDLVRRIRERFGPREVELRLDANGGFGPLQPPAKEKSGPPKLPPKGETIMGRDEALYKLELLSQYAIHSIEQPIRQGQWARMADLCRNAPLPIALDEELIGVNDPEQKRQLLRIVKPAYIVLKPSLHGGMTGCREWISLAQEEGIGSWITSALESNVGLNVIAQFCSAVYGDNITMAQGLGTGQLFTDNIPSPLEIRGDHLWITRHS